MQAVRKTSLSLHFLLQYNMRMNYHEKLQQLGDERYIVHITCCINTVHAVNFRRELVLENATSGSLKVLEF